MLIHACFLVAPRETRAEPSSPAPSQPSAEVAPQAKTPAGQAPHPAPRAGHLYFLPGPSFGVNPVYGVMVGVGATASYYFGDPKTTRASNMLAGLSFTTNGQILNTYRSIVYTKDDGWILLGDWRYLDTSEPTFGLGTGPDSAKLITSGQEFVYDDNVYRGPMQASQLLAFNQLRLHETVFRRLLPSFYAGIGYHLDLHANIVDQLLDLDAGIVTSHYAYSQAAGFSTTQAILSGFSLNLLYDSRDSAVSAYHGTYAHVAFRYNPTFLGSDQDSTTLWLEFRKFFDLSQDTGRDVIGLWAFAHLTTSGALPYLDLFATSYDQFGKSGRSYVQGRFRGEHFVYTEMEYRRRLFSLGPFPVGAVAFFNLESAAMSQGGVGLFQYIEPGGGAGLRLMFQKATRATLAIDYGFGNYSSSGFYVRMNETF